MNLIFLAPMAFAALLTLALPLVIHLSRRQQLRPIQFSALRWLRAASKPQRRLHLEDWPLLLVRLLLLALISAWLAQPALWGNTKHTSHVAVLPGISTQSIAEQKFPANTHIHWLSAGATPSQSNASLIRQLDAQLPANAALTVLVPSKFSGADAQTLQLSRKVNWRITNDQAPATASAAPRATPSFNMLVDANYQAALPYFKAAAFAWQTEGAATHSFPIWLHSEGLPENLMQALQAGETVVVAADTPLPNGWQPYPVWRDETGATLAEAATFGKGRLVRFTRTLTPQAMPQLLEADFPERLRNVLQPNTQTPTLVDAQAYLPRTGAKPYPQPPQPLQHWLALLIACVFLVERSLAMRRRQEVAA